MPLIGTITTISVGTTVPSNADGLDGGIYFRISGGVVLSVWKKDSGAWAIIGDINPTAWTSFTPSVATETGTLTTFTATARYRKVGNFVIYNGSLQITNAGTGGGYIAASLPFASIGGQNGAGHMFAGGGVDGVMLTVATIPFGLALWKYDGTTAITAPMAYTFSITYETT